jgi:hypothetical protein
MALLLGISRQGLDKWEASGTVSRAGRDLWNVGQTFQAVLAHERSAQRRPLVEAEAALKLAKKREIELRTEERKGVLILLKDALDFVVMVVGFTAGELNALPAMIRCARNNREMRAELDQAVTDMILRIRKRLDDAAICEFGFDEGEFNASVAQHVASEPPS